MFKLRKTYSGTIRTHILAGFVVAGLLPLIGALFVYETLNDRSLKQAEFQKIAEIGGEAVRQVAMIMDRASSDLDSVVTNPTLLDPDKSVDEKVEEMERLVHAYHLFTDFTLYDSSGFVLGTTRLNHPGHRDRSRWFSEAYETGKKSVTSPFKVMGEEGLFLTIYLPLVRNDKVTQLMTARMAFGEVWRLIDGLRLGKTGEMFLLDDFGNILASRDKTGILTRFDRSRTILDWYHQGQGIYLLNGEPCLFTAHSIGANETKVGRHWTLLCFEPESEVEMLLAQNRFSQAIAAGGGLVLACLLGLFVSRHLSKPIERAAETAEALNRGDFQVHMPNRGPQEMKRLATSFNTMVGDLKNYREDMESKVARRTAKLKNAQAALQKERASLAERVELRTRELRAANSELARSARMKDEFLAGMSHELRTPLNAVLGLTESLEEGTYGDLNERQIDTLHIIDESGRHLLALINDILDVAKAESGEMQLDYSEVDIQKLCESSLNLVKQTATKKNLRLETKIASDAISLAGDERRMKQILVNLLSNAVKFTPSGGVCLEVVTSKKDQTISFIVSDTGIGIAEDQIDRLFQPFVQLDSALDRQYEGTGLGLALVYNMAEIHGGCVTAESKLEEGTKIKVTFPLRSLGEVSKISKGPLKSKTICQGVIVLADDNESELIVLAKELNRSGYEVHMAHDGSGAVEIARQVEPDAILLDLQMPGMDGLEATHLLRGELAFRDTPIIGLTALNTKGDIRRIHEAGMSDCVPKPAQPNQVISIIDFHVQKSSSKVAAA